MSTNAFRGCRTAERVLREFRRLPLTDDVIAAALGRLRDIDAQRAVAAAAPAFCDSQPWALSEAGPPAGDPGAAPSTLLDRLIDACCEPRRREFRDADTHGFGPDERTCPHGVRQCRYCALCDVSAARTPEPA